MVKGTSNVPLFTTDVARIVWCGSALTVNVVAYLVGYSVVLPQIQVWVVDASTPSLSPETIGTPTAGGQGRKTALIPDDRQDSTHH